MAKFRMVAHTRDGIHISNPLGIVEAVRAQRMTRQMLHSNSVDLVGDTQTLRRDLAEVDSRAQTALKQGACAKADMVFPVAWSQPLKIYAVDGCQCESCVAISQIGKKEEEHPEFAFPKVDHCGLLVEEEDEPGVSEAPATIPITMSIKPRQPTLVGRLLDLACWFIGVEPGL